MSKHSGKEKLLFKRKKPAASGWDERRKTGKTDLYTHILHFTV